MRAKRVAGISGKYHIRHGAPLHRVVGSVAQQLESRVLLSSSSLIKNIYPDLPQLGASPTSANMGSELLLAANDGAPGTPPTYGDELWKTDGTAAGTSLVKDINPGTANSNPTDLVTVGNQVFFVANDGTDGTELWKSDGTAAGTVMVKDIVPGSGSSNPNSLTNVNGTLFFSATDASGNAGLWKSDGTAVGTVEVATVAASGLTNVNGTLFFVGTDAAHGGELWKSDGTDAGTVLVDDINPGPASSNLYSSLTAVGSEVFFATGPGQGALTGLWKSDGTAAGTVQLKNIDVDGLYNFNGMVYFGGPDIAGGSQDQELWKTDGTPNGTVQITRVGTVQDDFIPAFFRNVGGTLVVGQYNNFQDSIQLYCTDGTQAGTAAIPNAVLPAGDNGFNPSAQVVNGLLYFINEPGTFYQTNGTSAGTVVSDPSQSAHAVTILGQAGDTLTFAGSTNTNGGLAGPIDEELYGLPLSPPPPPTAAATLARVDSSTEGSWRGVYGSQGYDLFDGPQSLPSYAQVTVPLSSTNASQWIWQNPTADPRALQEPSPSTSRIGACDYSGNTFSVDVNLTDGQTHQVALEVLDYDAQGRAETVQVSDAATGALLDSRTVSNFQGGQYLVYDLTGHVKITFINNGPANAVLSGIFVDPKPAAPTSTASYVATDSTTEGHWTSTYGSQGYDVFGGGQSLPSYASIAVNNAQFYEWAAVNSDATKLQTSPGSTSRIAACDYSNAASFSINVNLTDGRTHQLALYFLDWDNQHRAETISISDTATGASLASDGISNFSGGVYVVFDVSGNVTVKISNSGGLNEVLSGIFLDPASAASFVGTDTATQGSWTGVYGSSGYYIAGGQEYGIPSSIPLEGPLFIAGLLPEIYSSNSSDPRALQDGPGSSTRIEAVDYAPTSFYYNIDLTNGKTHQFAVYVADYDSQGRSETIQISDAITGAVLDSEFVSNFQNGKYLVWNVSGDIDVKFTQVTGPDAVDSGLFLS